MCVLATVGGECVRDLLASVMVTDANVLSFTVGVLLCCAYSGLLGDTSDGNTSTQFFFPTFSHQQ